jgi:hypothetical protein
MSFLGFIDDGQTLTRFIKGKDRVHYNCRVTFRPVPPIDQGKVEQRVRDLSGRKNRQAAEEVIYQAIADRLLSWEFVDDLGSVVEGAPPPNVESVKMLCTPLQDRLVGIVYTMVEGGDQDPFELDHEQTSAAEKQRVESKNSTAP